LVCHVIYLVDCFNIVCSSNCLSHVCVRAEARQQLECNNPYNFQLIDKSLLVLCLDDTSPSDADSAGHAVLAGNPQNRWYDKIVQLVVFRNGRAGINGEHSPLDAPATGRMADAVADRIKSLQPTDEDPIDATLQACSPPAWSPLKWNIPSPVMKTIAEVEPLAQAAAENLEFTLLRFDDYGMEWIRSYAKLSPDAWMQMALQLAYRKLMGKGCATYETAQTRQYFHGRTETVRVFSTLSRAFTETMLNASEIDINRRAALEKAITSHNSYMQASTRAAGCDRHMLYVSIPLDFILICC